MSQYIQTIKIKNAITHNHKIQRRENTVNAVARPQKAKALISNIIAEK